MASVKAWKSITKKDPKYLLMSEGSNFYAIYYRMKIPSNQTLVIIFQFQCGVLEQRANTTQICITNSVSMYFLSAGRAPISDKQSTFIARRVSRRWHPSCTAPLMGEAVMSCAICGGCYQRAFSGQCVLPIFSACPWCCDVLVVLISRGARHSLLTVICWEWSCANQGHMGRMMEERLLEGQIAANSIWILGSQRAPRCCGIERPGAFRVSGGAFHSISSVSQPENVFLYELKAWRMLVSLCFWHLTKLIFGVCFFNAKAQAYKPALCTVFT